MKHKKITDTDRINFIIKYTFGVHTVGDEKGIFFCWDLFLMDKDIDVSSKYLRRSIDKGIKAIKKINKERRIK